jgi:hypothetical protein
MDIAVIENSVVVNVIVADSIEIAQEVTGLVCVEYTNENPASIGDLFQETTTDGDTFKKTPIKIEALEETPTKTVE